jgi:RNA-directed DNA polymerase
MNQNLYSRVHSIGNLQSAFIQVKMNKGAPGGDRQTVQMFEKRLIENLEILSASLCNHTYQPQAIKRVLIPKAGGQPLGIPTVRDRVVQTTLLQIIEPIFEQKFAEHSYGFRSGRSCHQALHRTKKLLNDGYVHVLDADLKGYFDTIPHESLMALVTTEINDEYILALIRSFLEQEVLSDLGTIEPEAGTPQGAVISPLLSNIYLDPLDHRIAKEGWEMVRYADDFVILCQTKNDAKKALIKVQEWTEKNGLLLHPEKTRLVDETKEGFDFLGYQFKQGNIRPSLKKHKQFHNEILSLLHHGHNRDPKVVMTRLNSFLRGWFEYFQFSQVKDLGEFDRLIRSQLRKLIGNSHPSIQPQWANLTVFSLKSAARKKNYVKGKKEKTQIT